MPQTDIKLALNQGYCDMPPEEGNVVLGWFQTSGSLMKINHGLVTLGLLLIPQLNYG